jgi:hypothetical protein
MSYSETLVGNVLAKRYEDTNEVVLFTPQELTTMLLESRNSLALIGADDPSVLADAPTAEDSFRWPPALPEVVAPLVPPPELKKIIVLAPPTEVPEYTTTPPLPPLPGEPIALGPGKLIHVRGGIQ